MFLKVCNHDNIIYNTIKKWLFEDVLPLKICILNKNKQTDSGLKDYIKKKNNIFLFYNNYVNDCSVKLVILNKKIIMLIINKNNWITEFKLYKLIINNSIYK